QVESDVVVPVEAVSAKREYAARTIRPKIHRLLDQFLQPLQREPVKNPSVDQCIQSEDISDIPAVRRKLDIERSVPPSDHYPGGTSRAKDLLDRFIREKLDRYDIDRNDPVKDVLSNLSPYLHFGQISPLYITLKIRESESPGKDPYLEELLVRRELSMNFCYYTDNYDEISCLPQWALDTLFVHAGDKREHVYSLESFERGETHDPYWNAAQMEMVITGKMHGYMRMYWGKKILEWTDHPGSAYGITLYLNDKYELDGRDPNGYAGIAWCFGNHDQAWKERSIFGKVRYMNANGLQRKFDADGYVEKIRRLL
ncbi:MAG TPA: deoxyribodipyrimidine photolyase, partial [bacterium]|nr:deoxyribodipyrimidine photolyase [bacterium]